MAVAALLFTLGACHAAQPEADAGGSISDTETIPLPVAQPDIAELATDVEMLTGLGITSSTLGSADNPVLEWIAALGL